MNGINERNRDVDWNRDRYGNHVESVERFFKRRLDTMANLSPIDGETYRGWIERQHKTVKNWEDVNVGAHIYGRKMWHTHKNPSGCWICDGITICEALALKCSDPLYEFLPDQGFGIIWNESGKKWVPK